MTLIASFLGYAAALWQMTVWYNRSVGTTLRSTIDGLIYAAITAAIFAYFWPAAREVRSAKFDVRSNAELRN